MDCTEGSRRSLQKCSRMASQRTLDLNAQARHGRHRPGQLSTLKEFVSRVALPSRAPPCHAHEIDAEPGAEVVDVQVAQVSAAH
mmetsp:Transcript_64262/g.178225  ORF Transcript_64262/g.178225 Transcript_64262/m.178225 type:complete len:84 (-) Transcript_64262:141-392(-)